LKHAEEVADDRRKVGIRWSDMIWKFYG